ncbi:MAG: hypothetical protein R3B57_07250 [Phycisphaerales bacterium]
MRRATSIFFLTLSLVAIGLGAQPAEPSGDTTRRDPMASIPRLDERLTALDPAHPEGYFELGEEVAAQGGRELATQLHALALAIALETGDTALAAGACIALADLAGSDQDRRWLTAVARALDDRFAPPSWSEAVSPRVGSAAERAAEVFEFVRAGDGYEARTRLDDPEIRAAIERALGAGWIDRLRKDAEAWPCSECRNRRFVPDRNATAGERLCSVCGGDPGPALDRVQLLEYLSAEAQLLGVERRSWAALLLTGGDEPLRDPDPTEVAPRVGVNPKARYWRSGRWAPAPTGRP